jgi:hypothetical protein
MVLKKLKKALLIAKLLLELFRVKLESSSFDLNGVLTLLLPVL